MRGGLRAPFPNGFAYFDRLAPEHAESSRRNWPRVLIASMTALSLVLSGCATSVPATDLSRLTVQNDRAQIEQVLGTPLRSHRSDGIAVAVYTYEKGHSDGRQGESTGGAVAKGAAGGALRGSAEALKLIFSGGCSGSFCGIQILLIPVFAVGGALIGGTAGAIKSRRTSSDSAVPRTGHLAAVYDGDQKLAYVTEFSGQTGDLSERSRELASLFLSARSGDADALFELSQRAFLRQQKMTMLAAAADKNHAEAAYAWADLQTDDMDKIRFLEKSASLGHAQAAYDMGARYLQGRGVPRDTSKAQYYLGLAEHAGNIHAASLIQESADFTAQLESANTGDTEAQFRVAQHYNSGRVVAKDGAEEIRWLTLAAGGDPGNAPAQKELGDRYLDGQSVAKDVPQALRWYERAAANNNVEAQYKLGTLYDYDYRDGIRRDLVEALKWYAIVDVLDPNFGVGWRKTTLLASMSAEDAGEAERRAREWFAAHPNPDVTIADISLFADPTGQVTESSNASPSATIGASEADETSSGSNETAANEQIEQEQILSAWRDRTDILRKAIIKEHQELFEGRAHFEQFSVTDAAISDTDPHHANLEVDYVVQVDPSPAGFMVSEPESFRRSVVVDLRTQEVVRIGKVRRSG